jgi:hypothetical protein
MSERDSISFIKFDDDTLSEAKKTIDSLPNVKDSFCFFDSIKGNNKPASTIDKAFKNGQQIHLKNSRTKASNKNNINRHQKWQGSQNKSRKSLAPANFNASSNRFKDAFEQVVTANKEASINNE